MSYPFTRILGLTDIYPSTHHPEEGIFIHSLFHQFHLCGYPVRVLNPRSWLRTMATREGFRRAEETDFKTGEKILTPHYVTVSSRLFSFNHLGGRLTFHFYRNSVERSLPTAVEGCDWVYAHFFRSGWAAIDVCAAMQRDCFVALGESNLAQIVNLFGRDRFAKTLSRFAGVIAVSQVNEKICRDNCPQIGNRLVYLPNGVDHTVFFPRNRMDARRKLNLPMDAKIVIFCGHFIERKGVVRLLVALESIPDIYGVFLGRGPDIPKGERVLFAGPVDHEMVPWWLSAADLFALPSTAEGMSNAIIEALACGLPVVVSDLPFNREFLDNDCAVFVNPFSVSELAQAISSIFENQDHRTSMASAALICAQRFNLALRAHRILDFCAEHTRNSPI